jgi:hypothetical protein
VASYRLPNGKEILVIDGRQINVALPTSIVVALCNASSERRYQELVASVMNHDKGERP